MPDIPQTLDAAIERGPEPSGRRRFAAFLSHHGPLVLTLVPLAWLIWVIGKYSVEVPCMDQWELVPLLDKMYRGGLTFHDLLAQHNEHRIFFPYIIMLGLARLTGWNIRCEMAVNVLLAAGILVILVRQTNKTARKLGMTRLPWAMPALSLVVFSITQYQNWLWGWQIQMLLNLLAVLGGIVVLAGEPFGWPRFAAAALLGIVASFSFANGVLFWPVGLFLLLAVPIGVRQRMTAIAGWVLVSALTVGAYFHHYRNPEGHPPLDCLFHQPLTYVAYLLKYFGNFFGQHAVGDIPTHGDIALAAGLVGIMALGWAAGVLLRGKIADFRTLLPYFAMCLYSFITALVTGVGRLGFGSDEATFSRYCTMMVPFWASLVIFLFLLAQVPARGRRRVHRRRWFRAGATRLKPVIVARQMVGRWSLRAAMAFLLLASFCAMDGVKEWSYEQSLSRDYLLSLAANPGKQIDYQGMSQTLYPWPVVILERYPILIQLRLSLFRNWKAPATPK